MLAISNDGNLGSTSGALSFDGGALQFLAGFTTNRAITLDQGGGTLDTHGYNVTLAGLISGSGELIKIGVGVLTLSHSFNSYSGGISLNDGTLDVGALGAAGTGKITFGAGSETLSIENAALANNNFGNIIDHFGAGDVIDLTGLASPKGVTASYNPATSILTVTATATGQTDTLTLTNPAGTIFSAVAD